MRQWLSLNYPILMWVFFVSWIAGCATKGTITGGARDQTPPAIQWDDSTPQAQTNTVPEEVVLTFDEWIKLSDPYNQILFSPPLGKRPEIQTKGKSVVLTLDPQDTLLVNTTYSINFGSAIADLNEGNVLNNFVFVFSTGDVIDSLSVQGNIFQAEDAGPAEGILVMLYEENADTLIQTHKPLYASKTNKAGYFKIPYMKEGKFFLYAILDENLNFLYDPPSEKLGFLDTMISSLDTSLLILNVSNPRGLLYVDDIERSEDIGILQLQFNQLPLEFEYQLPASVDSLFLWDTIVDLTYRLYHAYPDSLTWPFLYRTIDTAQFDTIVLTSSFESNTPVELPKVINGMPGSNLVKIKFNHPVLSVVPKLFTLNEDSLFLAIDSAFIDTIDYSVMLQYDWVGGENYLMEIRPGAVFDHRNQVNDSLETIVRIPALDELGNYQINLSGMDTTQQYIFQLESNKKIIASKIVQASAVKRLSFENIEAGRYTLIVIEDENRNGLWDPASLIERKQPEKIHRNELESIRANWDVEIDYQWGINQN